MDRAYRHPKTLWAILTVFASLAIVVCLRKRVMRAVSSGLRDDVFDPAAPPRTGQTLTLSMTSPNQLPGKEHAITPLPCF